MNSQQSAGAKTPVTTTKDTIATYKIADMRRVFQYIEVNDLLALDRLILSGRAFLLPKGLQVYVLDATIRKEDMCKLRRKESVTEIWASTRAITDP